MDEHLVGHALFPGSSAQACQVDTHPVQAADGTLQIHVTRYPVDELENPSYREWEARQHLTLHHLVTESGRGSEDGPAATASVVVSSSWGVPPLLALEDVCRRRPHASVVGIPTSDRSALVWVSTSPPLEDPRVGYVATIRSAEPGPTGLYPSALYGWVIWWSEQAGNLDDEGKPPIARLPLPPPRLDVVEAWRPYRVHIEQPERVTWPAATPSPSSHRSDPDE